MTAQRMIGFLVLVWATPLLGQFDSTVLKIPTNAVIRLDFEKTNFLIGENIFANYVISNGGGPTLRPSTGGDYRGGTRANRFKVTAARSDGYQLLSSVRQIFTDSGATRITSKQLLAALEALPGSPWQSKITNQKSKIMSLAHSLRPFGIKPRTLRIGNDRAKGYDLTDFTAAFAQFLNP